MTHITSIEKLRSHLEASPTKLILYHATSTVFHEFDARTRNRSDDGEFGDNNSDFGIHLSASPHYAHEFAELQFPVGGVIAIVEAEVSKLFVVDSYDDYLNLTPEQYAEWRQRLIAAGYDGVIADDIGEDLSEACVIFDPAKLNIVGHLPVSTGWEPFAKLEELRDCTDSKWPGIDMSWSEEAAPPEDEPALALAP